MKFKTYGYTNVGSRNNNEDYYYFTDNLWVLADGLGGHESGEVASKVAVKAVRSFAKHNGNMVDDEFLNETIRVANQAVLEEQKKKEQLSTMRTTLVFATAEDDKIRYANVGDSRFYYFKNGKLVAQSEDHTVSGLAAKMGDISVEDIRNDPDKNKLIKVLGEKEQLVVKYNNNAFTAEKGDAFLLCSDGFWEYVYELEMELDLAKSSTPKEWIKYMIKRLFLKTEGVNNDNFTVIGVIVD